MSFKICSNKGYIIEKSNLINIQFFWLTLSALVWFHKIANFSHINELYLVNLQDSCPRFVRAIVLTLVTFFHPEVSL